MPGVAVDVGDRAATRRRVHERRVVGQHPEFVLVDLDLAQVGRAHGAVGDRQLVGLAGAVVGHRQRVRRRRAVAREPPRLRRRLTRRRAVGDLALRVRLGLAAHLLLLSTGSVIAPPPIMRQLAARPAGAWRDGGVAGAFAHGAQRCGRRLRETTVRTRGGDGAGGSPCGPRRGGRGRRGRGWCGCSGRGARADAAVLAGRRLRRLANGPAHDQEQRHDRDLQQEHQPDERPRIHACDRIPGRRRYNPRDKPSRRGLDRARRAVRRAALNCVIACSSPRRASISGARQARDALGAELLDVERGEHGRVGHRAAQQLVGQRLVEVRGDVADEAAGERVAGAGRVDDASPADRRAARRSCRA